MEPIIKVVELYGYLVHLSEVLRRCDRTDLSESVLAVTHFASGSSSEFLGEAWVVLAEVEKSGSLQDEDFNELRVIRARIDAEWNRRNEGRGGLFPVI